MVLALVTFAEVALVTPARLTPSASVSAPATGKSRGALTQPSSFKATYTALTVEETPVGLVETLEP